MIILASLSALFVVSVTVALYRHTDGFRRLMLVGSGSLLTLLLLSVSASHWYFGRQIDEIRSLQSEVHRKKDKIPVFPAELNNRISSARTRIYYMQFWNGSAWTLHPMSGAFDLWVPDAVDHLDRFW